MAGAAGIHVDVKLVTEDNITRISNLENHVFDRVALYAFQGSKGLFPVMTGAAGFAFYHGRHGVPFFDPEVENGVMAGFAIILDALLFKMFIMIKDNFAEMGYFNGYILDINRISG